MFKTTLRRLGLKEEICVTNLLYYPGDFMKDGEVYEDLSDFGALKKYMADQLEDYNMEPGVIPMNLVLFRDAIEHG
jgi:dynein heavy chain